MTDPKITPKQDADPFASVDKEMLENPDLSWAAKGVLASISGMSGSYIPNTGDTKLDAEITRYIQGSAL